MIGRLVVAIRCEAAPVRHRAATAFTLTAKRQTRVASRGVAAALSSVAAGSRSDRHLHQIDGQVEASAEGRRKASKLAAAAGRRDNVAAFLADAQADSDACNTLLATASGGRVEEIGKQLAVNDAEQLLKVFEAAAAHDDLSVIARLLAGPRVDPTACSWAGDDALTWAVKAGHTAIVDLLLKDHRVCPIVDTEHALRSLSEQHGAAHDFSVAMLEAVESGHLAVLQRLAADERMRLLPPKHLSEWYYFCDYVCNDTLLSMAVRHGRAEIVDWLLAAAAVDPSAHTCRALMAAAQSAGDTVYEQLRKWEAEAKLRGEKWTWEEELAAEPRAFAEGEKVLLAIAEKLLADPRVDPSVDDDAALAVAARAPNRTMFSRLLADPRVNIANPARPAIVSAAGGGDVVILGDLLRDPRVDPSKADRTGTTALAAAASHDQLEAVKLLLADPGVDPAAEDNLAIRMAGNCASLELLELLLADPCVDPTARSNEALCNAVRTQNIYAVERLLAVPAVAGSLSSELLQSQQFQNVLHMLRKARRRVPDALQAVAQQKGLATSA